MGMMIDGRWRAETRSIDAGAFVRRFSVYGEPIEPQVIDAMAAEPGRFHLVASLSCPWSHRTMLVRAFKGLEPRIGLQIAGGQRVEGYPANGGRPWRVPGTTRDIVHLHELYALGDPGYTGGVTVPLLWDAHERRIVSNESAHIMRAFDAVAWTKRAVPDFTLVPNGKRAAIDSLNMQLHVKLSNAVYRAGMAQRQDAYDAAVDDVFATLDRLEARLARGRLLFGAVLTECDLRLFPTLVRFDAVYHTHFRCTRRRLVDYPNLWAYARDLFALPGVAATVDLDAIREGYYRNDGVHNPYRIVGAAPLVDWREPHGRGALGPIELVLRDGSRRVMTAGGTTSPARVTA